MARLRKAMDEMIEGQGGGRAPARARLSSCDHLIGDAYRDFIVKDLEQWRAVAKAANIKIELESDSTWPLPRAAAILGGKAGALHEFAPARDLLLDVGQELRPGFGDDIVALRFEF